MSGYLGETPVHDLSGTPFEGFEIRDWVIHFLERYGQIDGAHHKAWVLDQIARIAHGTPVVVVLAKWDNGRTEYRASTSEQSSNDYLEWVESMRFQDYAYDEGAAP